MSHHTVPETRCGGGLYEDGIVGASVCVVDSNCLYGPHGLQDSPLLTSASSSV